MERRDAQSHEAAAELAEQSADPLEGTIPGLPKIVPFRSLCRCGDEVWIENDGTLYRLRRTRQGKLILTK